MSERIKMTDLADVIVNLKAKLAASERECEKKNDEIITLKSYLAVYREDANTAASQRDEALQKLEQVEKERDALFTQLAEMTEDRDLWAGEHDEHECPYHASLEQARELLREAENRLGDRNPNLANKLAAFLSQPSPARDDVAPTAAHGPAATSPAQE